MRYLTHHLNLFKDYYGAKVYRCSICEIYLYTVYKKNCIELTDYYLITYMDIATETINMIDFNSACSLNCNDYIIKKLLE